jgi:hypothetical protein
MNTNTTTNVSGPISIAHQLFGAVSLIGLAVLFPFMVHHVPAVGGVPWGARLLAMFVAPFAGLLLFRFRLALVPAIIAPFLNGQLFGSPSSHLVGLLTVELIVFTAMAAALLKSNRRMWLAAPLAFLAAKTISGFTMVFSGLIEPPISAGTYIAETVVVGLPGLAVLVLIHIALLRAARNE